MIWILAIEIPALLKVAHMLGQSMIAIQKPGDTRTVVLLFLCGYSCLSSQIGAAAFNWDFTVVFALFRGFKTFGAPF